MADQWNTYRNHRSYLLVLSIAILVTESGSMPPPSRAEPAGATLVGRVVFRGAVPPPAVVAVTRDATVCGESRTIQSLVVHPGTGGIQDAVVSIERTPSLPQPDAPAATVIANRQCVFSPHIETIRVGAPLEIRNDDPVLHNTHLMTGSRTFLNVALVPEGHPVVKVIKIPGLYQIRCDAHRFMQGYIMAFDHPWHAVTQTQGDFRIAGVLPGRRQVTVWHETLGTIQREITVPAQGDLSITIEFP